MFELKSLLSKVICSFIILPPQEGLPPGINDHSQKNCVAQSEFDPILHIRVTLRSENGIQIRLQKRTQKTY